MKYIYALIFLSLFLNVDSYGQSDDCATATILPQTCTWYTGTNVGFTTSGSGGDDSYAPADICAGSLENTAWYEFTPTVTANYDIIYSNLVCSGGGAGIQSGILAGPCGGPYVSLGCSATPSGNNCFEISSVALVAGTTYYIVNDGDAGADCTWEINICFSTCVVTPSVGTFTITQNGTPVTSPIYLCEEGNDCFSLVSNDDYILPPPFGCEISEVM